MYIKELYPFWSINNSCKTVVLILILSTNHRATALHTYWVYDESKKKLFKYLAKVLSIQILFLIFETVVLKISELGKCIKSLVYKKLYYLKCLYNRQSRPLPGTKQIWYIGIQLAGFFSFCKKGILDGNSSSLKRGTAHRFQKLKPYQI